MKSRFDKNYTDRGYLMKYEKPGNMPGLNDQVYQFRIELLDITPAIWRRIQVPANYNFWDLHVAIQDSMGWNDCHLHHFEIRGKGKRNEVRIGIPDFEGYGDLPEVFPGWEIFMFAYFNDLGVEAKYEYDYGDGWIHIVKLEGYMHKEKGVKYPLCIDGDRSCPPEDCGGPPGYNHVVKVLSDPKNNEYKHYMAWTGGNWKPDKFNVKKVKFDDPYKRWENAFLKK